MSQLTRRTFVQSSTVAAGAMLTQTTVQGQNADSSSKLRAAVLGVNGRGRAHMEGFESVPNVEVAILCDPDAEVLAKRAKEFEQRYSHKVETVTDMRDVFDRKDIDVVGIATPNHWHTLATIWACQAGKDVYVEKPGTHNVSEGRKMIEAAQKHNRIVQHGVQLRSNPELQRAVELMREGTIGEVYMARGLVFRDRPSIGNKPNEPAPESLDWNLWQGPAAERDFSRRLVHYNWHWHWDYGNGDVGNQGVHQTDMCLWGLGVGLPSQISAMGGKFLWEDDKETPEVLSTSFVYPDEKKMIEFEVRPWITNQEGGTGVGNIFYGTDGYLVVRGYNSFETYLGKKQQAGPKGRSGDPLRAHFANFIEAVRTRDTSIQNGPVETAHTSSALAHLGNISYRVGRRIEFDPATETIIGDAEASRLLTREYRAPFVVPDVV